MAQLRNHGVEERHDVALILHRKPWQNQGKGYFAGALE
jgi:hypothetical protein